MSVRARATKQAGTVIGCDECDEIVYGEPGETSEAVRQRLQGWSTGKIDWCPACRRRLQREAAAALQRLLSEERP